MAATPDPPESRRASAWLGLGLGLLALAVPLRLLPDGRTHGSFAQFVGRFHPALVHIPIALLALAPLMELGGSFRRWAHLRPAAGFVLALATLGAVAAAFDGWLLAYSGGYSGPLVVRHLWGGVALAGLCILVCGLRWRFAGRKAAFSLVYLPLLCAAAALMVWTSDQGGKITHGDRFLTEYMPGRLRAWLGLAPAPAAAEPAAGGPTFYRARIVPILERSCVSCHNPKKEKGGLLLDTYEHLMKGGDDGPAVVPWRADKSELLRRVLLPRDDDDFMPSNGKNVLAPEEVRTLRAWIAAGASADEPADAGL